MATKKTKTPEKTETKKPAPVKKAPKVVAAKVARGPRAAVVAKYTDKEKLVATLVAPLAQEGQDQDALRARLLKASNHQLLHLARTVEAVNKKWGSRAKLITALSTAEKKAKDKDYVTKLGTLGLPQLLDLALSAERRSRI
jgi:hypothetical protein